MWRRAGQFDLPHFHSDYQILVFLQRVTEINLSLWWVKKGQFLPETLDLALLNGRINRTGVIY
jgi:hypothetical protein